LPPGGGERPAQGRAGGVDQAALGRVGEARGGFVGERPVELDQAAGGNGVTRHKGGEVEMTADSVELR